MRDLAALAQRRAAMRHSQVGHAISFPATPTQAVDAGVKPPTPHPTPGAPAGDAVEAPPASAIVVGLLNVLAEFAVSTVIDAISPFQFNVFVPITAPSRVKVSVAEPAVFATG